MKDIYNYEGLYAVSTEGKVWSYPNHMHNGRWLKPSIRKGYYSVCLCKNNKKTNYAIHRIVAETYLPKNILQTQINHKDLNKFNNNLNNLEWVTLQENINHFKKFGNRLVTEKSRRASSKNMINTNFKRRKFSKEIIIEIRNKYENNFSKVEISTFYNMHPATLKDILEYKTYKEI